ncbi:partial putative ABC transporter ATP-binding protein [Gammaproteobacteria bacterium]|nr:partial putative ABC transporter ATP-binding protein [Gammaproteobacteria bacterium]
MPLISLDHVARTFDTPAGPFTALRDVSLDIERGEFVTVIGQSGSGKSTLLGLLAGIDHPTSGTVHVAGTAVHTLSERAMSAWRGTAVGIVFQFFQLLPTLTALENVMLPMDFCGTFAARERRQRARQLLERVGVADQAHKLPHTLSGGQQQRVAIARALANEPPVLLADEPTGNLDSRTSAEVLALFDGLVREGQTLVMATHAPAARAYASRVVSLADGVVIGDEVHARA